MTDSAVFMFVESDINRFDGAGEGKLGCRFAVTRHSASDERTGSYSSSCDKMIIVTPRNSVEHAFFSLGCRPPSAPH